MTTALITGVAGQDGVYLARRLRAEGTDVVGTVLPGGPLTMAPYLAGVTVVEHDVRDTAGFRELMARHDPDEIYNLAAISSVGTSWQQPDLALATNGDAVAGMLEVLLSRPEVRFFQAASGEEQGAARDSPYARGKATAHALTSEARERHDLFACSGILFNHESPLRGRQFVTRKIARAAAEISLGVSERVALGNLGVSRDWGHARDYVDAMVRMLRRDVPEDFEIATGIAHSLEDLLELAFEAAGLTDPWQYVDQDPLLQRPADTAVLLGDPTRAREALGWQASTDFQALVTEMVTVDLDRVRTGVEEHPDYLR